jgi:hypothetical protein
VPDFGWECYAFRQGNPANTAVRKELSRSLDADEAVFGFEAGKNRYMGITNVFLVKFVNQIVHRHFCSALCILELLAVKGTEFEPRREDFHNPGFEKRAGSQRGLQASRHPATSKNGVI